MKKNRIRDFRKILKIWNNGELHKLDNDDLIALCFYFEQYKPKCKVCGKNIKINDEYECDSCEEKRLFYIRHGDLK
jgi:hypothetical protein